MDRTKLIRGLTLAFAGVLLQPTIGRILGDSIALAVAAAAVGVGLVWIARA